MAWLTALARIAAFALMMPLLAGCAAESYARYDRMPRGSGPPVVVLMPPDVLLTEVNAGGVHTPNGEWTRTGTGLLRTALAARLRGDGIRLIDYRAPADASPEAAEVGALTRVGLVVGQTIVDTHYTAHRRLPTKDGKFDWTVGRGQAIETLRRLSGADYALFVRVRDSYADASRVVLQTAVILAAGFNIGGGRQTAFAALLDLDNGEVAWFNVLDRGSGDLRSAGGAAGTAGLLLDGFPK